MSEFFDEVQRVLRVIEANPGLGSPFDAFSVVYRKDEDEGVSWVQAVMHLRRPPGYWKGRV